MSVKKNLTIATLAALLAIPAFGVKNVNAANLSLEQDTTPWEAKTGTGNWDVIPRNGFHKNPDGGPDLVNPYTETFHKGGHTYTVAAGNDSKGTIIGMDGNNNVSNAQIMASLEGKLENINSDNSTNEQNNYDNDINSNQLEYQHNNINNGKLVQTGESNNTKTEIMAGTIALIVSIGMAALSMAKKHKDMAKENMVANTNNIYTSNDDHNYEYSNKGIYHMIMSNTFKDISKNLK